MLNVRCCCAKLCALTPTTDPAACPKLYSRWNSANFSVSDSIFYAHSSLTHTNFCVAWVNNAILKMGEASRDSLPPSEQNINLHRSKTTSSTTSMAVKISIISFYGRQCAFLPKSEWTLQVTISHRRRRRKQKTPLFTLKSRLKNELRSEMTMTKESKRSQAGKFDDVKFSSSHSGRANRVCFFTGGEKSSAIHTPFFFLVCARRREKIIVVKWRSFIIIDIL